MTALPGADEDRRGRYRARVSGPQRSVTEDLYRRRISHDIEHQLSTIVLLASAASIASDVGEDSRRRVAQIVQEARWLSGLIHIYDADLRTTSDSDTTRLDLLVASILRPLRMSFARVTLDAEALSVRADMLASWRALRNIILNAITAAGARGRVDVRIFSTGHAAVVEVADDGPGCDQETVSSAPLGLGIVASFAAEAEGQFTIVSGPHGGCVARLELPLAK